MPIKKYLMISLFLLVSACASKYQWTKESGEKATLQDLADCRKEAAQSTAGQQRITAPSDVSSSGLRTSTRQQVNNPGLQQSQLNYACMNKKGYKQTKVEE